MTLYVLLTFTALLAGMAISVKAFGTGGKRKRLFREIYFSIEDVDGIGILYTKTGEYSAILRIENPVQKFSADIDSYYEYTRLFTALAQELLDKRQPGTFNQAMMDFGATVCTPHRPHCEKCPLADTCEAVRQGLTDKLPVKRHQTKSTDRYFTYLYVMCGDRICIRKRTQNDIWKGLYELPLIESAHRLNENELTERPEFKLWLADGSLPRPQPLEMGVRHVLSHQIIHADFYALFLSEDTTSFHPFLRAERADLTRFAFPRLIQAFLERH